MKRLAQTAVLWIVLVLPAGVSFAVDRGRVQVYNNTVVTDTGVPLRGENPRWDWSADRNNPNWWANLRDNYRLNCLRILCYRSPINGDVFTPVPVTTMIPHLDDWVEKGSQYGFYIIIDYHPVGGHDPADMQIWWAAVAPRYSSRTHVIYEICNEPGPGAYYARDVLEPRRQEIRAVAPDTFLLFWSLENAGADRCNMVLQKTPLFLSSVDWYKAAVAMHMYYYDLPTLTTLRNTYPLMNSEIGGMSEAAYMPQLNECEQNLHISWILLDGATAGRIQLSTVYWPKDPFFTGATQMTAKPFIYPAGGSFMDSSTVTLTSFTDGTDIRYTTDGADPTGSSTLYTAPFVITETTTIKAKAFKTGLADSLLTTQTITIAEPVYLPLPGRLEAEDYREGGEGVGYHDTTAGNTGDQYRADDVDIEITSDVGGGYNVGYTDVGEWLAFDVNIAQAGYYDITARVASGTTNTKTLHLELDGVDITGPISFTSGCGTCWQTWEDVTVNDIAFPAGNHQIRVVWDTAGFNLNYVDVAAWPGGNRPPQVDAGPEQSVTLASPVAVLDATVTDDGLPDPPAAVVQTWTKQSGPGNVTFGDPNAVDTTATFTTTGEYILMLTAGDGELDANDTVRIIVDTLVNPSFEIVSGSPYNTLPSGVDQYSIADVPGWTGVGADTNIHVDSGDASILYGTNAFAGGNLGGELYQMTNMTIEPRDKFILTFDGKNVWQGLYFDASLFYDDGAGSHAELVSTRATVGDGSDRNEWVLDFQIPFEAIPGAACIGRELGVKFTVPNLGAGQGWVFVDNVRLDIERPSSDINGDGLVDEYDLALLAGRWLWTGAAGTVNEDIIQDGSVDFIDYAQLAKNWLD